VAFARHGARRFARFSAPFGKKKQFFWQKKSKTACFTSSPEKETVEIGERRDRGCLFFRMIEMIAKRKELMSPPFASATPPLKFAPDFDASRDLNLRRTRITGSRSQAFTAFHTLFEL
jgi:hypothetical protein